LKARFWIEQACSPCSASKVHPFEDGNGRIGRAIAEKALAESLGQPMLTALAATILARRKNYYKVLEAANKENEITRWLMWFAGVAIEAQLRTIALVEFLIDKTKLLDRLKGQLNARQKRRSCACCAKDRKDSKADCRRESIAPSPEPRPPQPHATWQI
jgi:Fic family protein